MEARDERRLLRLQKQLAGHKLDTRINLSCFEGL
jgi:hypothetical protein